MRHPGISSSLAGEQAGRGFLPVDPPGRKPIGMTVCSGIGAAEVSAPWIDWRYQSEIEEFPSAVLAHRFPNAVNLGDMTNFKEWPDANVDVLCGGTPCQSFSIAGLRKGLADPRGNLALTYLAIAAKYSPRWVVWENVPGVLSAVSHPSPDPCPPDIDLDGNDGPKDGEEILVTDEYTAVETHALWCFVAGAAKLGYHGGFISLDAQHVQTQGFPHAVPQRRERLFFVGYLGDWRRAAAVLFDGESLQGNPAPRRKAGQSTSVGAASGVAIRGREGGGTAELTGNVATALRASQGGGDKPHVMAPPAANPLTARMHKGINTTMDEGQTMVAHSLRGEGFDASDQCAAEGCDAKPHAKGFCKPHYSRWKLHGNPLAGRVAEGEPLAFLEQQRLVDTGDCILWPYGLFKTGYPSVYIDGANRRAHRVMCEWVSGPPEQPDLDAAHSCGNCSCVNPRHLRWATRSENMADTIDHGTAPRGERHGGAVLDEPAVLKIVARLDAGNTHQAIADAFNVSRNTITDIAKGKNWTWLTGRGTPIVPVAIQERAVAENPNSGPGGAGFRADGAAYTLEARSTTQAVAFSCKDYGADAGDTAPTLRAMGHDGSHANAGGQVAMASPDAVRRLTPTECERLQGFPDGFTAIKWRGKPADFCPDGPRYKALGNSWAVNCGQYVFDRIQMVEAMT